MCSIDGLLEIEAEVLQKGKRKRDTVSCREYYCYKLHMRDNEENGVLHSEIKEHLLPTDETQNKLDLISRLFRAKVEEMKTDLLKRNIFEKVAAFMYTTEFQKHVLPHAHFLLILADDYKLLTPEAYDKFVSAELPDADKNSKNEIKEYQSARWVSPPEAMWRLFAFPISEMTPSVYYLQLHLDGLQFVSFRKTDTINSIVKNPMIKKTMLTEFFLMNETNKDAKKLKLLYKNFSQYFVWSSTYKMWIRRQRGNVIGRVVTCHPTEGERYYLRLLLMNVRGPKSYKYLLTVNGICCDTFRESAEKRGLLHCDNNLVECMSEAACYQMPYSLRRLFATILVYCSPRNPRELWEQLENSMSEDFNSLANITAKDIHLAILNHINDILHSMGHDINEFNLVPETIKSSKIATEAKEVYFERNIIVSDEDLLLHTKLNTEQKKAYDIILQRVFSNKSGAFFIDGPGSKQSSLAYFIRDAKLIVWDEVSMAKKNMIEALNSLLKDIMDTNTLFGGKVVVFGGDFRQTLHVVQSGKKEDFIRES
ncbi:uncharacterized protein LOC142162952 [Nicotiana tabacum]|uniref:Uncharacterized protein LOC142162952 n=1 Tax=Nicotiana tabacum TaxID=4097 RepID=A0AC58RUA6_TOBAC